MSASLVTTRARRGIGILGWLSPLAMLAAIYGALIWAPPDADMGDFQRIFYFHVPSAWIAFLSFFVTFLGGIAYLRTRKFQWDFLAVASAEIGVVFTTAALITGSIWAKPIWGGWWTWDPRLTTTLVLWFIYVSYLILRKNVDDPSHRASLSAVVGMVGFVDVPIVFMSIRWWRTIHPIVFEGTEFRVAPVMMVALLISLAAFTIFYAYLLKVRIALEKAQMEIEAIEQSNWD
ncbi:MAG: cytochrome c biogenesis protein CcsA [Dehalococcoidia bacterium]|nr:cytochrome c biogenesis protein CcsA [Dehalococcoidia bacterium]